MAISNLSNQHISASYQFLTQISPTGDLYDGLGNQITSLNLVNSTYVTAQTASYVKNAQTASYVKNAQTASYVLNAVTASYVQNAQTASYVLNAVTASYVQNAQTASYLNTLNQNVTLNGNLTINGTGSFTYVNATYESASIIFSSGSNQLGDATNDVQTLVGSVLVSGSFNVTGSTILSGSTTLIGTKTITGSVFITGSKTIIGTNTITGSLLVSGSQNFVGTKTLSGSIFITGSKFITGDNYITGSHNVSGSMTLTGPSIQNSAPLLTTLVSGSMEFDGSTFYRTVDASGRSLNANHHLYYLPSSIVHTVNTIASAFTGSLNVFTMQSASLYEVQYNVFYTKSGTGGIITWTINADPNTMQNVNATMETSPIGGTNHFYGTDATSTTATSTISAVINKVNTLNIGFTLGTITAATNHKAVIKALIWTNATGASKLKLQITQAGTGTTIWPGSYYTIKKMPVSSVGVFIDA